MFASESLWVSRWSSFPGLSLKFFPIVLAFISSFAGRVHIIEASWPCWDYFSQSNSLTSDKQREEVSTALNSRICKSNRHASDIRFRAVTHAHAVQCSAPMADHNKQGFIFVPLGNDGTDLVVCWCAHSWLVCSMLCTMICAKNGQYKKSRRCRGRLSPVQKVVIHVLSQEMWEICLSSLKTWCEYAICASECHQAWKALHLRVLCHGRQGIAVEPETMVLFSWAPPIQ